MFNFETSDGQVMNDHFDHNETSPEQALIPINKQIQTLKNKKNKDKRENFKNEIPFIVQDKDKQPEPVHFQDNLKTGSGKDYREPL